jgi:hypothetical protein
MARAEVRTPDSRESIETTDLEEGDVFEVLSNQRRRYAYHYLKQVERRPVDIKELTDHVAAWEYDKEPRRVTTEERNRVATALRQFHLPKMDETGFVNYDRQRGRAVLREEAADLEVYLDVVPGPDVPWGRYYLGLAGIHGLLVGGTAAGVGPLAAVGPLTVAGFVVATLLASAGIHTYVASGLRYGSDDAPPEVDDR